jgi:hypothetical protein
MDNLYKVEANVPLPSVPRGAPSAPIKYPWGGMNIGDSFFVPLLNKTAINLRGAINIDLKKFQAQSGKKIKVTTRAVDNGIRIWRIK